MKVTFRVLHCTVIFLCQLCLLGNAQGTPSSTQNTPTVIEETTTDLMTTERVIIDIKIVVNKTNTSAYIKWNQTAYEAVDYTVTVENLGANHYVPDECKNHTSKFVNTTTELEYNFLDAFPDYNYSVSVTARNSEGANVARGNQLFTTDVGVPEKPRNVSIDVNTDDKNGSISLIVNWTIPCRPNGAIKEYVVAIAGKNNVTGHIGQETVLAESALNDYRHIIQKVLSAANYTISITAIGVNKGETATETCSTPNVYPLVSNITFSSITSDHFVLQWTTSQEKQRPALSYFLNIKPIGPNVISDLTTECTNPIPTPTRVHENLTNIQDTMSYSYKNAISYYTYKVTIVGSNAYGNGPPEMVDVTTMAEAPGAPINLTLSSEDENVTVSWEVVPCVTSGPINYSLINITGCYSMDENDTDNSSAEENYIEHTHNYTRTLNLKESYNYMIRVSLTNKDGLKGEEAVVNISIPDGLPGKPTITNAIASNTSIVFQWDPPVEKKGEILFYEIEIKTIGPLYEKFDCVIENSTSIIVESADVRKYIFPDVLPYYNYSISIRANTSKGYGQETRKYLNTPEAVPDNVRNIRRIVTGPTSEAYDANLTIEFVPPCHLNGPSARYTIYLYGKSKASPNALVRRTLTPSYHFRLSPEYTYEYYITVDNSLYVNSSEIESFTSPAGIPILSWESKISMDETGKELVLKKTVFDQTNGELAYMALILSDSNVTVGEYNIWNNTEWPSASTDQTELYLQLTEDFWKPFENTDETVYTLDVGICEEGNCPIILKENTKYFVIIRVFNKDFYRNVNIVAFTTDSLSKLGTILGSIFGVLGVAVVGLGAFVIWKKKLAILPTVISIRKSSARSLIDSNTSIPVGKFIHYCKQMENNPEKIAQQFHLLAEKTNDILAQHTFNLAKLPENRRKNRYVNILPYDETRVHLLIDEDDEIGSDYINASYIKGYKGMPEYIATQGPLPTTCRDFWKMVLQENVTIIVMVSEFIENNKEKCFRYFPKNHESMSIGDDMEVRCTVQLHFGMYCVRTLQIKRDKSQSTVTHMQFLEWPDFGVPSGTDHMLQFCMQIRERYKQELGYILIHCSAGVGRTGTIIATDILLQCANARKNIDIFNTVLNLRRQRTHMVQTEKQYMYIHNLVKDYLDRPSTPDLIENIEPVYEIMSVIHEPSSNHSKDSKESSF